MKTQNITEYTNTRSEIRDIKSCITTYVGYLLGGSGFAMFGLVSLSKADGADASHLAYASFSMAFIVSLVLLLLMYKFTAHNRYAGYSKLLNHERYETLERHKDVSFISWEIVWDRIMNSDYKETNYLVDMLSSAKIKGIDKEKLKDILNNYAKKNPIADSGKYLGGIKLFIKMILSGKVNSSSWTFPGFVFIVCFCLCSIFMVAGIYISISQIPNKGVHYIPLILVSIFFVLLQLAVWLLYVGKLYSLFKGSGTIDGFCWRFIPARAEFLNSYGVIPNYDLLFENDQGENSYDEELGPEEGITNGSS